MSEIVFIEPHGEDELRLLALVLEEDGGEVLVAMADADVRIAGHLDIVLVPSPTLPCAVAVFSHAVAWVSRERIVSTLGTVPDSIVDMTIDAGAGVVPPKEMRGMHMADPLIDPRAEAQVRLASWWLSQV
jgi:hypothetical protein